MKRYHEETHIMRRQQNNDARMAVRSGRRLPLGRYRKKHALDCGNARCGICHSNKRFGHEQTRQEQVASLRMADA